MLSACMFSLSLYITEKHPMLLELPVYAAAFIAVLV
jgi:hypothetical protein